jgi:CHAD domain-containing protein
MSFRLSVEDANLQAALRRIAQTELGAAAAHLSNSAAIPAGDIHDIRKRIKKLRGLLRLVRPGFSGFARENAALRDIGRSLASRRDADVRLATFDRLTKSGPPEDFAPLRARLVADRDTAHLDETPVEAPREALLAVFERSHDWRLKGRDHDILVAGLAATRSAARATMAKADRHRHPVEMHDWRKRAKDYWYQTRLLQPAWPEALDPFAAAASTLTEDLGDHHDIGVLADWIADLPKGLLSEDLESRLASLAQTAQSELEARIFPLGSRLFAGNPDAVARQWARWWQIWRG